MHQTRVVSMTEGGVLAAVAVVFALVSVYIPVLGTFVNLIWPVPVILLGVRHGFKWSILTTIVAGAIIALMMHPLQAASIVVGFGLIGIVLGHAIRSGMSPARAMLWGGAASLVSKAAVLGLVAVVMGINPLNTQSEAMGKAMEQAMNFYRTIGLNEQTIAQTAEMMQHVTELMKIIIPAAFVMAAGVDTYLNFVVARAVLKKLGHPVPGFPPFKNWHMPLVVAYAFGISLVMIYFGKAREVPELYSVGLNLQMLSSVLLLIQGLALFYFLADKYSLSRFVRGLILVLIFSNGILTQAVIFTGAFDLILDYRHLRSPRSG